jgi:hypothetical protein
VADDDDETAEFVVVGTWSTMTAGELTAILTAPYIGSLEVGDLKSAFVACIAANLIAYLPWLACACAPSLCWTRWCVYQWKEE